MSLTIRTIAFAAALCLTCAATCAAANRETKIQLVCLGVSQSEVQKLLTRYCQNFRVVSTDSDYMLYLTKKDEPSQTPYSYIVMDPEDHDTIAVDRRSSLPGAAKDACSAMHIRFGEDK